MDLGTPVMMLGIFHALFQTYAKYHVDVFNFKKMHGWETGAHFPHSVVMTQMRLLQALKFTFPANAL